MIASTERAVLLRENGSDALRLGQSHARWYFGSETCETLLPAPARLGRLLAQANEAGRAVTLVTPPCTDVGLGRVARLLALLVPASEVVCNDWGVLELVRQAGCEPVLGRLLVRVARGFHPGALAQLARAELDFLRHADLANHEFQAFLGELGVRRVELDNLVQGYALTLAPPCRSSLYLPYAYLASGRKCIHARLRLGEDGYRRGRSCRLACGDLVLEGEVYASTQRILVSRNAHYYTHAEPHPENHRWSVDRIVDCSVLGEPWADPRPARGAPDGR
jgi:hypothetical protein